MLSLLFFPRHEVSFQKMLVQCRHVQESLPYQPIMVVATNNAGWSGICAENGIDCLDVSMQVPADPVAVADIAVRRAMQAGPVLAALLRIELLQDLWRLAHVVKGYAAAGRFWRRFMQAQAPFCVMMPGDRELGFVPAVLKSAAALSIPAVICTSNIPTVDSLAANRRGERRFQVQGVTDAPLLNRLVAWFFPRQMNRTIHGPMLFSPGWLFLALRLLGMASANPWSQGGGNSSYVIVDGQRKRGILKAAGVEDRKILMIGDLAYDLLFRRRRDRRRLRENLAAALDIPLAARWYVLAVPIYAEHNYVPMERHLRELRVYAAELSRRGYPVILSFHPRSDPEHYDFLIQECGFKPSKLPLLDIIAACDVFICGNSSTIDWAVLCGLPTINLDYAGIHDRAFDDCRGVVSVTSVELFSAALDDMDRDYDQLVGLQQIAAVEHAVFDGQAGLRYNQLLQALAAGRPPCFAAAPSVV